MKNIAKFCGLLTLALLAQTSQAITKDGLFAQAAFGINQAKGALSSGFTTAKQLVTPYVDSILTATKPYAEQAFQFTSTMGAKVGMHVDTAKKFATNVVINNPVYALTGAALGLVAVG